MSVNRASEVWKEIKPFAIRDMNSMLDSKSGDGNNELYAIILYDESAQKIKYYAMNADGLTAALLAASNGDAVWIPAGTIDGLSGNTIYSSLSDNTKAFSLGEGNSGNDPAIGWNAVGFDDTGWGYATLETDVAVKVSPADALWMDVPKNYRLIFRHKFTPEIGATQAILTWDADDWTNGIYVNGVLVDQWLSGVSGDDHPPREVDISEFINFGSENVICIDQFDSQASAPGACSVSWIVSVNNYNTITVPEGVELVGLGKNSILNSNVVNNGILTNILVSGTISGNGSIRLVPNPTYELFSHQIKSLVATGTSPFLIDSTTLNINLNADMVDGKHASEFSEISLIPVQHIDGNVSNPPSEADLISVIGSPTTELGKYAYVINDNGNFSNLYLAVASGGQWWLTTLSQADQSTPTVTVESSATLATASGRWFGRASLIELSSGIWVLAYYEAEKHYTNDGELHLKFSDDYGATWSDEDKYLDGTAISGFPMNPPDCDAGEDAGEPWLILCDNGDLLIHMWHIDYGVTANGTYQSRSTDGGKTWSTPAQINFIGIVSDSLVFMTDDHFVYDGVIYAGARIHESTAQTNAKSVFVKSEDNGITWDYISDITDFVNYPTWEVGLEYIGNNKILAILRDVGLEKTYKRVSLDFGATWETIEDITTAFNTVGRNRVYTRSHLHGSDNWWNDRVTIVVGFIQTVPGTSEGRRNCVWVSKDQGETWSGPFYLDAAIEDAGYSDILYDPVNNEYVVISYQGTQNDADLKQYNITIGGI
jgi:hypothetical protein